jgi:hypothetical protein
MSSSSPNAPQCCRIVAAEIVEADLIRGGAEVAFGVGENLHPIAVQVLVEGGEEVSPSGDVYPLDLRCKGLPISHRDRFSGL